MSGGNYGGLLEAIEERFAGRMKSLSGHEPPAYRCERRPESSAVAGSALAVVSPTQASEIEFLAELCRRRSVPLIAEGSGTVGTARPSEGAVIVRFDRMRRCWPPEQPDHRVVVEPGIFWLEFEEQLRCYGRSAPVYPTSAPRATVGGWLAADGIGVGSHEFGWLSENVVSASVVTPGGGRHEIAGPHLGHVLRRGERSGVVVAATLRTRGAGVDTPFAVEFDCSDSLADALVKARSHCLPVWHLGLQNAAMARGRAARNTAMMMFGAYSAERSGEVEEALREVVCESRGGVASAAEAYRVWGSRFFPVSPARDAPVPGRVMLPVESLALALSAIRARLGEVAILGMVARGGEALLLVFDSDGGRPLPLAPAKLDRLLDAVGEFGGSGYRTTVT